MKNFFRKNRPAALDDTVVNHNLEPMAKKLAGDIGHKLMSAQGLTVTRAIVVFEVAQHRNSPQGPQKSCVCQSVICGTELATPGVEREDQLHLGALLAANPTLRGLINTYFMEGGRRR